VAGVLSGLDGFFIFLFLVAILDKIHSRRN